MTARRTLDDFTAGLLAPWRGLSFLARTRTTWPLAVVPVLVAIVLLCTVAGFLIHVALGWVDVHFPAGGGVTTVATRWLLRLLLPLLSIGIALYASLTLSSPLSSAALDGLVRVHVRTTGLADLPDVPWLTGAFRALTAAVLGVLVGAPFALLVHVTNLVFPPAALLTGPLAFVVSGYVIAWNLLDYPLGLRGVVLKDRARWMVAHSALVTGFALSASVLLFVPGLGLLLLPAGVVGAEKVVVRA